MDYLVGVGLALVICVFGTVAGVDRRRTFYPTTLIVIASFYALFAIMGGSFHALIMESVIIALFVLASVLGFKFSMWMIAAGLFAHGVFDFIHHHIVQNPGVPTWWPNFCMAYDVTAAAYLAWLLLRPKVKEA